jgi:hypothetical protein
MKEVLVFIAKMIENITTWSDLGPFLQTISWIFFISVILIFFRQEVEKLLKILAKKIKQIRFRWTSFEVIAELELLESVNKMQTDTTDSADGDQWEKRRTQIYSNNKGLFIAHVLSPSKIKNYYDIYIYLIKHNSKEFSEKDFSNIKYAEFFFGHMWSNKIFRIENKNKIIGTKASAYNPFLCTCRVTFNDNSTCELYKYIDFETVRGESD